MRIQHNIMAMNAYRNYNTNTSALSKNLEKLSSGYKINRAGDDAAGLAISEKMRAQITGLDAAQKNVKDGISLVKTAEGAMQEIQDMLNRMKYLATQSANGTYQDDVDREALQDEVDALTQEIDRIAQSANFNGQKLLDGSLDATQTAAMSTNAGGQLSFDGDAGLSGVSFELATSTKGTGISVEIADTGEVTVTLGQSNSPAEYSAADIQAAIRAEAKKQLGNGTDDEAFAAQLNALASVSVSGDNVAKTDTGNAVDATANNPDGKALNLQIGDTGDAYNQLAVQISSMRAAALGVDQIDVSNIESAKTAADNIVDIINTVSATRGQLGAVQNRLEHTQNNLSVMEENIQDAESTIRDTDVADEMMAYTKNNILIQSAQAMLAQANAVPQGVLQLMQ